MNYYNEHDPKAAAWLRELIAAKLIPAGEVDERDIQKVRPDELRSFTQCHFFAGIGGWPYALRLAGWPEDQPVWTGSCPCQPLSCAGKQRGHADERHLWPAFQSLIAECRPATVFGEQVASPDGREWLSGVRADLEGMGYAVGAADLCAAGVGAPHIRQRLYWVANAQGQGWPRMEPECSTGLSERPRLGSNSTNDGLANANGGTGNGSESRPVQWTVPQCCSGFGGLENSNERRCDPWSGEQPQDTKPKSWNSFAEQRSCIDGVGNTDESRSQGRGLRSGKESGEQTPWARSVAIPCSDGKARRIEPSIFPLAHGVSGRVGLLRGAGNAIVPQQAAIFIQAYMTSHLAAAGNYLAGQRDVLTP